MTQRDYFERSADYDSFKTDVPGIIIYLDEPHSTVAVFHGKRGKMTKHTSFKTSQLMMIAIDGFIKQQYDKNALKQKAKEEKSLLASETRKNVKVGDIFHTSWGYEQTNIDFFQVVGKPSPSKVIVRGISQTLKETSFMSGEVKSIRDAFCTDEKKCTIRYDGCIAKIDSYENTGYKTDESRSYHKSWYG